MKASNKLRLILGCCFLVGFSIVIYQASMRFSQTNKELSPFEITISDVKVISDNSEETNPKLSLTLSIENISEQEFSNVWFEIMLNNEVEPYIASHILSYKSEKMNVTTKENAQQNINDLNVCGFVHKWTMSLTAEEDLKEYYDLKPENLYAALKQATVNVYWKSGKQKNCIPILLENN